MFYLLFLPFIIWAGIIFYLSSIPAASLPSAEWYVPYIVHFIEYFILAVLALLPYYIWDKKMKINTLYYWGIFLAFYALTDEVHQIWVEGRQFSLLDLGVNLVAVFLVLYFYKKYGKIIVN